MCTKEAKDKIHYIISFCTVGLHFGHGIISYGIMYTQLLAFSIEVLENDDL